MAINLPLFSQRDEAWKSKRLGSGTVTIGGYGCLLTCLAMTAKYYGKDTDPDRLNQDLNRVGGFKDGTLYIWNSLHKVYVDISETKNVPTPNPVTDTQFKSIDVEIESGRPVICEVDFIPATSDVDMHFVVIIGKNNGDYIVADPWYGDTASLTRYGVPSKTIQKYIFTNGPLQPVSTTPVNGDTQNALTVLVDAFNALPNTDDLKKGNLEGYVRAVTNEHLTFNENHKAKVRLEAFVNDWAFKYQLPTDANITDIETEMEKGFDVEQNALKYRSAIEEEVGVYSDDEALLKALHSLKEEDITLRAENAKYKDEGATVPKYTFTLGGHIVKIY